MALKIFKEATLILTVLLLQLFFSNSAFAEAALPAYTIKLASPLDCVVADDGDVDGDASPDVLVGVPADSQAGEEAGVVYLFLGKNVGEDLILDPKKADYVFYGDAAYHHAGSSVQFIIDEDEDGLDEIEIGFGEDTLNSVIASGELEEFAAPRVTASAARNATVGVSVGVAEDVDCSLNPRASPADSLLTEMALSLLIGFSFLRWLRTQSP